MTENVTDIAFDKMDELYIFRISLLWVGMQADLNGERLIQRWINPMTYNPKLSLLYKVQIIFPKVLKLKMIWTNVQKSGK